MVRGVRGGGQPRGPSVKAEVRRGYGEYRLFYPDFRLRGRGATAHAPERSAGPTSVNLDAKRGNILNSGVRKGRHALLDVFVITDLYNNF